MSRFQLQVEFDRLRSAGSLSSDPEALVRNVRDTLGHEPSDWDLIDATVALANIAEWSLSVQVSERIGSPEDKAEATLAIVERMIKASLLDDAEGLARSIPHDNGLLGCIRQKLVALNVVARRLASDSCVERARSLLELSEAVLSAHHENDYFAAARALEIGEVWTDLGDHGRAVEAWLRSAKIAAASISQYRAERSTDADSLEVLRLVARNLFDTGERELARKVVAEGGTPGWREGMLRSIDEYEGPGAGKPSVE